MPAKRKRTDTSGVSKAPLGPDRGTQYLCKGIDGCGAIYQTFLAAERHVLLRHRGGVVGTILKQDGR